MRFQLLKGRHSDDGPDGKTYEEGTIVESPHDLVKLFGTTKFARLADPAPPPSVDEARALLDAAVARGVAELGPTTSAAPAKGAKAAKPPKPARGAALGVEVTDSMPAAVEGDLRVWQKGKSYFVTAAATPSDALNEEPLTLETIQQFLQDYNAAE